MSEQVTRYWSTGKGEFVVIAEMPTKYLANAAARLKLKIDEGEALEIADAQAVYPAGIFLDDVHAALMAEVARRAAEVPPAPTDDEAARDFGGDNG